SSISAAATGAAHVARAPARRLPEPSERMWNRYRAGAAPGAGCGRPGEGVPGGQKFTPGACLGQRRHRGLRSEYRAFCPRFPPDSTGFDPHMTGEISDADLELALSLERFARYLAWADQDRARAIELYTLNTRISESLYIPLQALEIALRNRIHAVM